MPVPVMSAPGTAYSTGEWERKFTCILCEYNINGSLPFILFDVLLPLLPPPPMMMMMLY